MFSSKQFMEFVRGLPYSWAAESHGRRDVRIDLLRGFAGFAVFAWVTLQRTASGGVVADVAGLVGLHERANPAPVGQSAHAS